MRRIHRCDTRLAQLRARSAVEPGGGEPTFLDLFERIKPVTLDFRETPIVGQRV